MVFTWKNVAVTVYTQIFSCTEMRWLFTCSIAIWVTRSDTRSVASRARTELTCSKCDCTRIWAIENVDETTPSSKWPLVFLALRNWYLLISSLLGSSTLWPTYLQTCCSTIVALQIQVTKTQIFILQKIFLSVSANFLKNLSRQEKWLYYLLIRMFMDTVNIFCDHSMTLREMKKQCLHQ